MNARVKVEVDEDLADLVPNFLARKRLDLEIIRDSTAPRDYVAVERVGHRLKGDGGAYGFDRMSSIGIQLQEAADRHDDAAIASLAAELLDYLDHIDIVYCAMEE
jgi:histidine phosphotransfer protein HptB